MSRFCICVWLMSNIMNLIMFKKHVSYSSKTSFSRVIPPYNHAGRKKRHKRIIILWLSSVYMCMWIRNYLNLLNGKDTLLCLCLSNNKYQCILNLVSTRSVFWAGWGRLKKKKGKGRERKGNETTQFFKWAGKKITTDAYKRLLANFKCVKCWLDFKVREWVTGLYQETEAWFPLKIGMALNKPFSPRTKMCNPL